MRDGASACKLRYPIAHVPRVFCPLFAVMEEVLGKSLSSHHTVVERVSRASPSIELEIFRFRVRFSRSEWQGTKGST